MTYRILVVCIGNICRSPVGEQVLLSLLDPACVDVTSAGLSAVVGHDIDSTMRPARGPTGSVGGQPSRKPRSPAQ